MLLHLRLTVPRDLSDAVVDLLRHEDRSANLTLTRGASLSPEGDLVECDVARELAGEVIGRLKALGLHETGGIVVTTPTSTPFAAARRLERVAPGDPDDAVIWDTVIEACWSRAGRPSPTTSSSSWPASWPRSPASPTRRSSSSARWSSGRSSAPWRPSPPGSCSRGTDSRVGRSGCC
jgi:hypothetical protein